jgi:phage anti-repressor protein
VKIRSSPQRRQKFLTACKSTGTKELMLILDIKTRWNSTYEMIQRGILFKQAVDIMASWDPDLRQLSLDEQEWNFLKNIAEFLGV